MFTISKGRGGGAGGTREPIITYACLIKREIRNLITIALRVFHFVGKGEHLTLVLSCKAN